MIRQDIRQKCLHLYGSVNAKLLLRTCLSDGASAVMLFRLSEFFYQYHLGVLGLVIAKINGVINSVVIGRGAKIGDGFVLQHPVGVVINGNVIIGINCVLQSGVTIGSEKRKSPELGNNVSVGSGAKVIGGVRIGDNVRVGANAVVLKDVPPSVTVVGIPARVVG